MRPRLQTATALVVVALLALFGARTVRVYHVARTEYAAIAARERPSCVIDGIDKVLAWIRSHPKSRVVGESQRQDPLLYQRMTELLYPQPFCAYADVPANRDVVAVMPTGHVPPGRWRRVLVAGDLQVFRSEE